MGDKPKSTFARRVRAAKPRATKYEIRDDVVSGLALAVQPSGVRTWFLARMVRGRRRYATLGSAEAMTIPEARREARRIIASYIEPAKTDDGPRTPGHPMGAFAAEFLDRQALHWKPSGRRTVRIYLKARILPAFGGMPVDRVGPEDVAAWFDAASRDKPGAANRAFEILRAMMFRAEEWGLRERGSNPCLGIARNPAKKVARFLDAEKLARFGRALDAHQDRWPEAVAAICLLALTGCRRNEVLNLRWHDIGADTLNLDDSKTGPRDPDAFLFPKNSGRQNPHNIVACWRAVCEDAKLGRLRLHDLRHTAASQAIMSGENLPLIGKLLGHRRHRTMPTLPTAIL